MAPQTLREYRLTAINGSKEVKKSIKIGVKKTSIDYDLAEKEAVEKTVEALSLANDGQFLALSEGVIYSSSYAKPFKALNPNNYVSEWAAMAIDPTNSKIMYAATDGRIYRSTNGGESWPDVIPVRRNNVDLAINALYVSPENSNLVYIGVSGGAFVLDTQAKSLNLMTDLNKKEVTFFAAGEGRIFAKADGVLKVSADKGSDWSGFDTPDDLGEVSVIAFDGDATWFGGAQGLYKNTGDVWERLDIVEGAVSDISVSNGEVLVLAESGIYSNFEKNAWKKYADESATWIIKAPDLFKAVFLGEATYFSINQTSTDESMCPAKTDATTTPIWQNINNTRVIDVIRDTNIDWKKIRDAQTINIPLRDSLN